MSSHLSKKTKLYDMNNVHSKFGHRGNLTGSEKNKKSRSKQEKESTKYEMLKKSAVPDYTDVTYREAVSRLRYLLNESYVSPSRYTGGVFKPEESDEDSGTSPAVTDRTRTTRLNSFRRRPYLQHGFPKRTQQNVSSSHYYVEDDLENVNQLSGSPELMAFIERQEEYIDQLEKEAQYCRDELSHLLAKVKELISENELLQDQQKTGLMKVMFEGMDEGRLNEFQSPKKHRKHLEGPVIVFESRISELEAQLTQCRIDLRKAQEEAEMYKRKLEDSQPSSSNYDFYKQIENLQREKRDLNESLAKLQASINQIREKEIDASKKVQRTLDVVDKTQFEKQQAEMEVYRLKSELELQHDKLLEVLSEQTRKVADERSQAERRYQQHIDRLNSELTIQRDALSKMQMEVEKHQRIEEDLKRDLNSKNLTIENVKKELNNKIGSLQKELSSALAERDSLEQELNSSKMSSERTERLNKQESSRLQVEISALKKRLDGGDADLIHCRRENLRLLEKISDLEKELTLYKIKLGEQKDPIEDEEQKAKEKLMNSRISEIEAKHVEKVSDLEGLIENQSQVMAQLKAECQSLTQKLEESTARHKQEMENVQSRLNSLNNKMESNFATQQSISDDTSKEAENTKTEQNRYRTTAEENKYDLGQEGTNYSQRFLSRASRQNSSSGFETSLQKEQPYQSVQPSSSTELGYGNSSGNSYEASNKNEKQDSLNDYNNGQSNTYPNYYGNEPKSSSDLTHQEQQPPPHDPLQSFNQQKSPHQEQISFQEQEKLLQEQDKLQQEQQFNQPQQPQPKQQSSYQDDPTYREQLSHQEQPHFQEETFQQPQKPNDSLSYEELSSGDKTEESQDSNLAGSLQPSVTSHVEPTESLPPEPIPPPAEVPKTTASQRFQRAAELSRQSSRSDDITRGKLSPAQARARNSLMSRNQTKPQSRFK